MKAAVGLVLQEPLVGTGHLASDRRHETGGVFEESRSLVADQKADRPGCVAAGQDSQAVAQRHASSGGREPRRRRRAQHKTQCHSIGQGAGAGEGVRSASRLAGHAEVLQIKTIRQLRDVGRPIHQAALRLGIGEAVSGPVRENQTNARNARQGVVCRQHQPGARSAVEPEKRTPFRIAEALETEGSSVGEGDCGWVHGFSLRPFYSAHPECLKDGRGGFRHRDVQKVREHGV